MDLGILLRGWGIDLVGSVNVQGASLGEGSAQEKNKTREKEQNWDNDGWVRAVGNDQLPETEILRDTIFVEHSTLKAVISGRRGNFEIGCFVFGCSSKRGYWLRFNLHPRWNNTASSTLTPRELREYDGDNMRASRSLASASIDYEPGPAREGTLMSQI